tara:strand:+ start:5372 stop:5776 length:405 start_codon:yes stop_codon:yes gene_type:complete
MNKLNKFIEEVKITGNIASYNLLSLEVFDDVLKLLHGKIDDNVEELLIYCSPFFLNACRKMATDLNLGSSLSSTYGLFSEPRLATSFISELSFIRGKHTIYLITKDIDGDILIPMLQLNIAVKPDQCVILHNIN